MYKGQSLINLDLKRCSRDKVNFIKVKPSIGNDKKSFTVAEKAMRMGWFMFVIALISLVLFHRYYIDNPIGTKAPFEFLYGEYKGRNIYNKDL